MLRPPSLTEIGVVRTIRPAELRSVFGEYRPSPRELLPMYGSYAVIHAWLAFFIAFFTVRAPLWLATLCGLLAVGLVGLAVLFDAASVRHLSEHEIAYRAPLRLFSWSVPFHSIERCDVVFAKPHRRLRLFTRRGWSHSLPLTEALWVFLTEPPDAPPSA